MADYAVHYAAASRQLSSNLEGLLTAAIHAQDDHTIHGAIADAIEEDYSDGPLPHLIRSNYSTLNAEGYDGQHQRHFARFESRSINRWGSHVIGKQGPFTFHLRHIANGGQTRRDLEDALANTPTDNILHAVIQDHQVEEGYLPEDDRWVVHATTETNNKGPVAYNFEFPHSRAHEIPQMFPTSRRWIDPHQRTGETENAFRNNEGRQFEDEVYRQPRNR